MSRLMGKWHMRHLADLALTVSYDGTRVASYAYSLPDGRSLWLDIVRDQARPDIVSAREYSIVDSDGMNTHDLFNLEMLHDLLGHPTSETEEDFRSGYSTPDAYNSRSYAYNGRSELVGSTTSGNTSVGYQYAYDTIGNRTAASYGEYGATPVTHAYLANALNQYTYVDSAAFTYDADGNLTNDCRFAYAYDCENRLVSVTPVSPSSGDLAIVNEYDHRSRRVRKTVRRYDGMGWSDQERHSFVWDGWNIVLERIDVGGSTAHVIEYYWGEDFSGTEQGAGNAPVAKRSGRLSEANPKGRKGPRVGGLLAVSCEGRFYVPIYGGNGNIMGYVDDSGAFAVKFEYDPYGDVVSIEDVLSAPMPSPDGSPVPIPVGRSGEDFSFGFSTKYHDREVGLIAYQLRSYSPRLGRWLNRDPIEEEGGVNLYGFLGNNQICITDVLGLLPYQYQTTVWGTYWYPQPRRPKSPDRQPRISNFGTFLESILDFLVCNSGTTYYYYYPQHSATVRLLKHPQVAKVWKLFKSIKNPGAYSRGKIHYKATKFDYCMDVITFFNTNPMALVMPMPKISLETISNIMAFDVGYQALGSFDGEYTIKTNFDMCTKTLDMKLWNTWSLVSLTRNPFSERRSSFLSQETFERESHFWSDIKQFYIYFVVEPITRVEMWAR